MDELYELYRNSRLEKEELLKKIFPVRVENIDLKEPKVIGEYIKHWKQMKDEWAELVTTYSEDISPEQQEQYNKIKKIAAEIWCFLDVG